MMVYAPGQWNVMFPFSMTMEAPPLFSRAVLRAERRVALAGERPAHEVVARRAACDFATVFEFVTLSDRRFHSRESWLAIFE
nr:hypothetical protein [Paraburkholderia sacchari]